MKRSKLFFGITAGLLTLAGVGAVRSAAKLPSIFGSYLTNGPGSRCVPFFLVPATLVQASCPNIYRTNITSGRTIYESAKIALPLLNYIIIA